MPSGSSPTTSGAGEPAGSNPTFPSGRRVAATLGRFPYGVYLSDLHLAGDVDGMWIPELFRLGLEVFARGAVRYHFASADETIAALADAGFVDARVWHPSDVVSSPRPGGAADLVRVVRAALPRSRS